jgi:hypothetical protein
MSTTVSTGWTPPPLSALEINDCNAAAAWLGEVAQVGLQEPYQNGQPLLVARNVSIETSIAYVGSSIPSDYSPTPSDVDLIAWYLEFWINLNVSSPEIDLVKDQAELFPFRNCSERLCPALKWEGDPDVSGTGMIVTYYIEAGLATIFFIASAIHILRDVRRADLHFTPRIPYAIARRPVERLRKGFAESADKFLDYTLIFSTGYLLAAMCRFVSAFHHYLNDRPVPVYSLVGSVFMSAFSIFPAIMLQSLAQGMRNNLQRQVLWALIIMLLIILNIMVGLVAPRQAPDWTAATVDATVTIALHDLLWEQACDDANLKRALIGIYFGGLVVLVTNGLWWFVYTLSKYKPATSRIPQRVKEGFKSDKFYQFWTQHQRKLRIVNGIVSGVLMWIFLGMFHWYSRNLAHKAGESDQDTEWIFGQVLAPVAFAQVAFDLVKYGFRLFHWQLPGPLSDQTLKC